MIVDLDCEVVYQGRVYGPGRNVEMPDDCVARTILRTPKPAREIRPQPRAAYRSPSAPPAWARWPRVG